MAEQDYLARFSGETKAIIRLLTGIFLDTGLDVRRKHMFGHLAFLLNGHTFLLVGEWPRHLDGELAIPVAKGEVTSTVIFLGKKDSDTSFLWATPGAGYFAPGGCRLKSWVSTVGEWLLREEEVTPQILAQLERFRKLAPRQIKNPGVKV